MIQEYYTAGFQDFLEKLAKISDLSKVIPGGSLPASSLFKSTAPALGKVKPALRPQSNPSQAWQHGSVINYNQGKPSVRPRAAGEV